MQGEMNTTTDTRQGFCSRSTAVYTLAQSPLFDQDGIYFRIGLLYTKLTSRDTLTSLKSIKGKIKK